MLTINSVKNRREQKVAEKVRKVIDKCWSKKENETFLYVIEKYGKDYGFIQKWIPTKTRLQIRIHANKLLKAIR